MVIIMDLPYIWKVKKIILSSIFILGTKKNFDIEIDVHEFFSVLKK